MPTKRTGAAYQQMSTLDLSVSGVKQQWVKLKVAKAISAMEAEESWTVDGMRANDGQEVDAVLNKMAQNLSGVTRAAVGASVVSMPGDIIDLMGHIHTGRALSLMRWISEASDTAGNQLLRHAAQNSTEFGALLLERVTSLERRALLSSVFSPERMAALLDILDELELSSSSSDR